jgi:hypothetical protein
MLQHTTILVVNFLDMFTKLWYTRPERVQARPTSSDGASTLSATGKPRAVPSVARIPAALRFDMIINGGTCPVSQYSVSFLFRALLQQSQCLCCTNGSVWVLSNNPMTATSLQGA